MTNMTGLLLIRQLGAGKQVIYGIVEQAKEHLVPGGGLMLVIRTKQGAKSMAKKWKKFMVMWKH